MEVILQVPGTISKTVVLSLDGSTTPPTGVNPTHSLHVITTQLENTNHVVHQSQLHHVKRLAHQDTQDLMPLINGMHLQFIQYHQLLTRFKLKS